MRASALLIATLALTACGAPEAGNQAEANAVAAPDSAGVTLELPPALPFEGPKPEPVAEDKAEPAPEPKSKAEPKQKAETAAKEEPAPKAKATDDEDAPEPKEKAAGDQRLLDAKVPLPEAEVARTIERIGYRCGSVTGSNRVESAAAGPIYKINCSSGESYQGTTKGGRLFFRPWTGKLTRD